VFDLKIEEFKPEFAGKMNFYLSAADDQLRHREDQPASASSFASTGTKPSWSMRYATHLQRALRQLDGHLSHYRAAVVFSNVFLLGIRYAAPSARCAVAHIISDDRYMPVSTGNRLRWLTDGNAGLAP
jgi:YhcG PDDEXK nuclease domain